jgi:hypothetical protein
VQRLANNKINAKLRLLRATFILKERIAKSRRSCLFVSLKEMYGSLDEAERVFARLSLRKSGASIRTSFFKKERSGRLILSSIQLKTRLLKSRYTPPPF